ncbi:hypothetical protein THAOC_35916, partial [Thalassiosira oceanica]
LLYLSNAQIAVLVPAGRVHDAVRVGDVGRLGPAAGRSADATLPLDPAGPVASLVGVGTDPSPRTGPSCPLSALPQPWTSTRLAFPSRTSATAWDHPQCTSKQPEPARPRDPALNVEGDRVPSPARPTLTSLTPSGGLHRPTVDDAAPSSDSDGTRHWPNLPQPQVTSSPSRVTPAVWNRPAATSTKNSDSRWRGPEMFDDQPPPVPPGDREQRWRV